MLQPLERMVQNQYLDIKQDILNLGIDYDLEILLITNQSIESQKLEDQLIKLNHKVLLLSNSNQIPKISKEFPDLIIVFDIHIDTLIDILTNLPTHFLKTPFWIPFKENGAYAASVVRATWDILSIDKKYRKIYSQQIRWNEINIQVIQAINTFSHNFSEQEIIH